MKIFLVFFIAIFSIKSFSTPEESMKDEELKDISDVLNEARAIDIPKTKNYEMNKKSNSDIYSKLNVKRGEVISISKDCLENKNECTEKELRSLNSVK